MFHLHYCIISLLPFHCYLCIYLFICYLFIIILSIIIIIIIIIITYFYSNHEELRNLFNSTLLFHSLTQLSLPQFNHAEFFLKIITYLTLIIIVVIAALGNMLVFVCRDGLSTFLCSRSLLLAFAKATIRTMELETIRSCTFQRSAVTCLGLELVESFLPSSEVGFLSNGDTSA